jgi:hypothetical protein
MLEWSVDVRATWSGGGLDVAHTQQETPDLRRCNAAGVHIAADASVPPPRVAKHPRLATLTPTTKSAV